MNNIVTAFLAIFIACTLSACSDDSASPNDNGNGGNGGKDFAIVSIDQDSVYWGEIVNVTFKNAQTNAFRLFIHTFEVAIDTAWRDNNGNGGIRFKVPVNSSSGQVRIFEHDTVQARNSPSIEVLQKVRSLMFPSIDHFAPGRVYAGDLFAITGRDIPMRWRDMSVRVGDIELPIVSWDSIRIYMRVTPEMKTGLVTVRLFDNIFRLDTLHKLEHKGELLGEQTLQRIRIYVARLNGINRRTIIQPNDTTVFDEMGQLSEWNLPITFERISLTRSGDSLIGSANQTLVGLPFTLDLRLKLEPESRVSGSVRLRQGSPESQQIADIDIKSMRWMRIGEEYTIYTHSIDLQNELLAMEYGTLFGEFGSQTSIFLTGGATSVINIDLTP